VVVHKSTARLLDAAGAVIGEGRAYVHLRLPSSQAQTVQGTLSLDWWADDASLDAAHLALTDGPDLAMRVESNHLRECVVGRILRYSADWPGVD
jgi:hypothetical protein